MIWRALEVLDVWPARDDVVKVDEAPVGIQEGKNAGCFTIGVAASGNGMGLDLSTYQALPEAERRAKLHTARGELVAAGADLAIDSVADLCPALSARGMM
jgi:phosphonoacetaldehyde hydrolase